VQHDSAGHDDTSDGPLPVIFVCTGNICRSPIGDVVFQHLAAGRALGDGSALGDRLAVSSAGTGGWHAGEPMDPAPGRRPPWP
jgi:protein-tyrosine phosphatase